MVNILVTGANGQLGSEIRYNINNRICLNRFFYTDADDLDITDNIAIEKYLHDNSIELIINCAAYTAVDNAEDPENREKVYAVNASAPENLAKIAGKMGIWLIHISTDYVFDGNSNEPYKEEPVFEQSLTVYGESKRLGERYIIANTSKYIIIRTSWLYSSYGSNFVKTMLRLAKERESLGVVNDQLGSPTYAADLAEAVIIICREVLDSRWGGRKLNGIYHFSNEGVCTWYEFARQIFESEKIKIDLKPLSTADYPTKAKRPAYSVLDKSKIKATFDLVIPEWRDSLAMCLKKIKESEN